MFTARRHPRRGMALIVVLIVVAMLALSAYTFATLMVAENEAAILHGRQLQARQLVDSGVAHVQYFLELDEVSRENLGGVLYNTELFQAQLVMDNVHPRGRARFAVLAPDLDDSGNFGGLRFGLEDESARLNLNALDLDVPDFLEDLGGEEGSEQLDVPDNVPSGGGNNQPPGGGGGGGGPGDDEEEEEDGDEGEFEEEETDTSGRALLMQLPGMTLDIADAILDWTDDDEISREYGAEANYYSGLNPPYSPKNGPLETVEELLLIRGVTPDLLFGRDVNRNGLVDVNEQQLPIAAEFETGDGSLDRGWSALLTLYSMEKNVNSLGLPRIDLNGEDLELLYDELSALDPAWATFIIAYRQNGPMPEEDEEGKDEDDDRGGGGEEPKTEQAGAQALDLTKPAKVPITQVLDLIGVRVRAELDGEEEPVIFEPLFPDDPGSMASFLPKLMDNCSVNPDPVIPGRVNINRAPRPVLMAIPGMTGLLADSIISQRDLEASEYDEEMRHETWLLSRAIVTLDEMREMIPYVTGGGDVFRAQIVGYFDEGEISSRAEVVIDATAAAPRILFWRDISHLGRGYPVELLGVDRSAP